MVVLPSSNVSPFIVSALLSLLLGGNHAGIEERQHLIVIAMPHHFENDGLAGLEFSNRAPVIGHAGNRVDEVVALVHWVAVYRGDDVARLQTGLPGRTPRCDAFDSDTVGRAQLLQGYRIGAALLGELHTDRPARHLTVGDELIVNVDGGI